ncbi:MAG: septal ring lytic transglycosylase RlpA family protein [Gammaproteobacteria bacterium]|nr:septal ring lytic transglycosylase RlpA family protein [Gammaproteobacteria bacterium]
MDSSDGYVERGIASWYGKKFHGRRTSSGESYDMYGMTAAHKSLPLPSYVHVRNLENGRDVVVKVNDRGPFHKNRIIDMSYAAASKLGMLAKGTALVKVRAIKPGKEETGDRHYVAMDKSSPVTNTDQFYIQIGAFSSLENAEQLRMRLDSVDDKFARIYQTVINNRTLYRVRIGPLSDVETAG